MIITARQDQFEFEFPISFIPQIIKDKYSDYLNRLPSPITDTREFVNHSVQIISMPAISYEPAVQNQIGTEIGYRSSTPYNNLFEKDFQITFELAEGMINYFILFETFLYWYAFQTKPLYLDPFRIYFTDTNGIRITSMVMSDILFTGVDKFECDFTNNTTDPIQFNASFKFNKIAFEIINQEVISTPDQTTLDNLYNNNLNLNITSYFNDLSDTETTGIKEFGIGLIGSLNCNHDVITNEKISINFVRSENVLFSIYGSANEVLSQSDVDAALEFGIGLDPTKTYINFKGDYSVPFIMEVTLIDFCGNKRQIINIDNA